MSQQTDNNQSLNNFLASIEVRAYKQAFFAVKNEESALDIVQEAMMSLVQSYRDKPENEWPLLFTRILQNAINSHFRRNKVRDFWTPNYTQFDHSAPGEESDFEMIEAILAKQGYEGIRSAEDSIDKEQILNILDDLINNLPTRQREAFLLRYWEDISVAETAEMMGCSEGSVKTHCSRASAALANALKDYGITGSLK